jgi:hypothetical protein
MFFDYLVTILFFIYLLRKKSQVQRKAAVTEYIIKEKIDATEAAFNRAISVYQSFLPSTTLQANISMEEKKVLVRVFLYRLLLCQMYTN